MSSDRHDDKRRSEDKRLRPHDTNKKDAKSIRCRIFVGNLNTEFITRQEFEDIFAKHGKVIGASLHSGFGFVQYEKESEADEAVVKEHGSIIKEKRVDVNLAGDRRKRAPDERRGAPPRRPDDFDSPRSGSPDRRGPPPNFRGRDRDPYPPDPYGAPRDGYRRYDDGHPRSDPYSSGPDDLPPKRMRPDYDLPPPPTRDLPPLYSKSLPPGAPIDCEIIIINKQQRDYADMVQKKLVADGLLVECAHLPESVTLASELDDASRRGVLYGIIISSQHEVHRSVTVHILHGAQQEHRNMPLEDAIKLITHNFEEYMQALRERERLKAEKDHNAAPLDSFDPVTKAGYGTGSPPPANSAPSPYSHEVSRLLNMAADGKLLTEKQYSQVINELSDIRNDILRKEGRDVPSAASSSTSFPTNQQSIALQQAELQAKILSILNPATTTKASTVSDVKSQQPPAVSQNKAVSMIPVLTPSQSASTAFKAPATTVASSSPKAPTTTSSTLYTSNIIGMALSNLRNATSAKSSSAGQPIPSTSAAYYPKTSAYPTSSPYTVAPSALTATSAQQAWPQTQYRIPGMRSPASALGKPVPTSPAASYMNRMGNVGRYPSPLPNKYPRY